VIGCVVSETEASPKRRLLRNGGFSETEASPKRRLLRNGGFSEAEASFFVSFLNSPLDQQNLRQRKMSNFSGQSRGSPFKRDDPSKRRRSVSSIADHTSVAPSVAPMSADEKRMQAMELMKRAKELLADVEATIDSKVPDARNGRQVYATI
jgi:hypothetical protein